MNNNTHVSGVPFLLYFTLTYESPYPEGFTKLDLEKKLLQEGIEYHYRQGIYGAKATTLEGIIAKLPRLVESEWNTHLKKPHQLNKIGSTYATMEDDMSRIEHEFGDRFVRWLDEVNSKWTKTNGL